MPTIVKMPQLGESVVEGTVTRWLKAPGDTVAKLEPLLEIATDKIDTEIPAPAAGTLLEIVAAEGETVAVGEVLAQIGTPGEATKLAALSATTTAPAATKTNAPAAESNEQSSPQASPQSSTPGDSARPKGRAFISPVVARIASEEDVDLANVAGTGLGGRITKKDLIAHLAERPTAEPSAGEGEPTTAALGETGANETGANETGADETLHPLSTMRRAIAEHMVLSKSTSPHVTTLFEVDMTAVVRHREANRQPFAEKGVTLTYTPYFVAAVAAALQAEPAANSRFSASGIVQPHRIHIGIAVALADGLIVPVLRDADEKNLQGLARAVNEMAANARAGTLAMDATKGGTFTLTNHGVTGSLLGTPIINQPQSGILGIGAITKRPVVRSATNSLLPDADDALVIRPMCYLSFSFDHRVLDGAKADAFLTVVKTHLENW